MINRRRRPFALLGVALSALTIAPQVQAKPAKIAWQTSLPTALQMAKKTGKPVMIDFYATWCGPCKLLDKEVYTNAAVISEAKNWISVKIDADKNAALVEKYKVTGFPTIAFLKPDGSVMKMQAGLAVPDKYQKSMKQAVAYMRRDMTNTLRTLRAKANVRTA